jgi:hypothetical protein
MLMAPARFLDGPAREARYRARRPERPNLGRGSIGDCMPHRQ